VGSRRPSSGCRCAPSPRRQASPALPLCDPGRRRNAARSLACRSEETHAPRSTGHALPAPTPAVARAGLDPLIGSRCGFGLGARAKTLAWLALRFWCHTHTQATHLPLCSSRCGSARALAVQPGSTLLVRDSGVKRWDKVCDRRVAWWDSVCVEIVLAVRGAPPRSHKSVRQVCVGGLWLAVLVLIRVTIRVHTLTRDAVWPKSPRRSLPFPTAWDRVQIVIHSTHGFRTVSPNSHSTWLQ
jgi:hypothetical protein